MTPSTSTDIKEIKDLIAAGSAATQKSIADLDKKIADLDKKIEVGFAEMRGELKTIDVRLKNLESNTRNIMDLAEKLGELKNWKQIAIVLFTATVSRAIGWFVRTGKVS
jgi:predicted  nucleic acid-binding Zn-ribbon protein